MAKPNDSDLTSRYNRDEDVKAPAAEGKPPRHTTEPDGTEAGPTGSKTLTDPQTGEPNRLRKKGRPQDGPKDRHVGL
jgi:hypothetical protein